MSPKILRHVTQNFTMCNTQRNNDGKLKKKKTSVDFSLIHLDLDDSGYHKNLIQ